MTEISSKINLNKQLIKKYAKHIKSVSPALSIEIALFKLLEHDKLKYIKYIPLDLQKKILENSNLKYFNVQHNILNTSYFTINNKELDLVKKYINTNEHLKLLGLLDQILHSKSLNIFLVRRMLKDLNHINFECLDQYISNNRYVPKIVANFLDYFKDFLPEDFLEILIRSSIDLKPFEKLINKLDVSNFENITENLLVFDKFRQSTISKGFRRYDFLINFVKREDYEFYLKIENSDKLITYYNNNIQNDHRYYPHMHIYNLFGDNEFTFMRTYINKKNIRINKEKFYKILERINLADLFIRDVDIILLEIIIDVSCQFKDLKTLDSLFRLNSYFKNQDLNSCLYYCLVNYNLTEYLLDNLLNFVYDVDENVFNLLKYNLHTVQLKDYEKYFTTNIKYIIISNIINKVDIKEVVSELFKKYEDERDIYYEIIYEKSKLKDYDLRIFKIESTNEHYILTKTNIIENVKSEEIFENLKNSELFFKYCFNHEEYKFRYLDFINPQKCTLEEGKNIFKIYKSSPDLKLENNSKGNLIYQISTANFKDLDSLIDEKLTLINLVYNIRYHDGLYLFYKYADFIIESYIKDNSNLNKKLGGSINNYDCMNYLSNKYFIHVYNIKDKYFRHVLKFIDFLDYKYIKILIYLLNDTNINTITESKRLLKNMKCINADIDYFKTQIIECFIDKMNVKNTLLSILSLQINYMIDDTSLYLIIELVRRYIKDFKDYIFIILRRIGKIVIDKEYLKKEVFFILCNFVIQNNYYTEESVELVKILHDIHNEDVKLEELDILINNIDKDLRVSFFLVEVLKIFNNDNLTRQVIAKNVTQSANFLAYAFDLEIFIEYLDTFFPVLKNIYISRDNKVAVHAFSKLIDKKIIFDYIIEESFKNSLTRMSCIEILSTRILNDIPNNIISILYIYKYDSNGLIRKRVNELLKNKIENYNILLKIIYKDIFNYLNIFYFNVPDIANNVLMELVIKYSSIIDYEYCKINYKNIYECLLVNGIKKNKLIDECKDFSVNNINIEICTILLRNKENKDFIINILSNNLQNKNDNYTKSLEVLKENISYIFDLLMFNKDLISNIEVVSLLTNEDLRRLFKYVITNGLSDDNSMIYLLKNTKNINIEEYDIDTIFLYIKNTSSTDINLYKKVFSKLENNKLQYLIKKKNYKYLLDVSYKNITDYDNLINVLLSYNTVMSIERLQEIYKLVNDNLKEKIKDYLIYNYLIYENRSIVRRFFNNINISENNFKNNIIKDIINIL